VSSRSLCTLHNGSVVVVNTRPRQTPTAGAGLAVEPMTRAPNAFRSGDGLVRLEPGASVTTSWGIAPRASGRGE